ncbi:coiled-coil domain-containing protein [Lutimonas sp.]|uniref:coiled-coil domain-containing protein n=1 Tax=Lutimonas sp. TaxID=1872403 RepID=UPI003D9B1B5B
MKNILSFVFVPVFILFYTPAFAQETNEDDENKAVLQEKKEAAILEEKEALKKEVIDINERFNNDEITREEADQLKEKAADIHALNIENRIAILENEAALNSRAQYADKSHDTLSDKTSEISHIEIKVFDEVDPLVDINLGHQKKYDKRTHSNLLVAFGLNNAIIEGQSLDNSPYKIGKSKFFEIGWTFTTRVLKESNAIRFRYGFAFQFNGLNPTDNMYFVQDGELTYLEEFPGNLTKSKLRMDNLVFPVHLEFGPFKTIDKGDYIRYSTRKKFKFGIGSYFGFNMRTRQKLKYTENGSKKKEKITQSYNTSNLIYGLSSYIGLDAFSFYVKYDLNTIFNEPNPKENNISLGLRFDL